MSDKNSDAARRARMVAEQLAARDIDDKRVLSAMGTVPREAFVDADLRDAAYDDSPLPIGAGQTISQPYMVALMAQAARLKPGDRVLEIGTGSGYGAAVLDEIAGEVVTVERIAELAERARSALQASGHAGVTVVHDDGTAAGPGHAWTGAPYDAIVVTASGPQVPEGLKGLLADGGRLIVPVGPSVAVQRLMRITRDGETFREEDLGGVRFVPLIGAGGW